jgi:CheY-like chemotaxis protein
VRNITELHGGSIHVDSAGEGQGTTFTVSLPLRIVKDLEGFPVEAGFCRHPVTENSVLECPLELKGLQVLVVDDDEDARALMSTVLEDCGAKVQVVGSAAEALEALEAQNPDVLVSDIEMPREDGYWLIRQLRAREQQSGRRIPAVALTAHARAKDRMRALAEGFQIHLPKPVEPAELLVVVATLANLLPGRPKGHSISI